MRRSAPVSGTELAHAPSTQSDAEPPLSSMTTATCLSMPVGNGLWSSTVSLAVPFDDQVKRSVFDPELGVRKRYVRPVWLVPEPCWSPKSKMRCHAAPVPPAAPLHVTHTSSVALVKPLRTSAGKLTNPPFV